MRPVVFAIFTTAIVAACVTSVGAVARPAATTSPQRTQSFDILRRVDFNQLNLWTTNYGSVAWDLATGNPGLEYPKGSGNTAVFAAGLWLGAKVAGETRAVVAEYVMEYGPGPMVGGTYADPTLPQYRVYKVLAWSGDPADTGHVDRAAPGPKEDPLAHDSWSEYMTGAVPDGAPWQVWDLPDPNNVGLTVPVPGPAVASGQLLWCVYNDADPALHTIDPGSSTPLGVEIQQTTRAPIANSTFALLRYRIINKGTQQLDEMYVSMWSDPDLGGASDDLVGTSEALGMVYAYNANNADQQYGPSPPAVGFVLLEGPKTALGDTIPATSALKFIGGTDPLAPTESYNSMLGLDWNGNPVIDPTTGLPTTFWVGGDPVQGTGWLDSNPSDRRMMISSGPFAMAPGDTQEVEFAIAVGQGTNRLSSITALRALAYALNTKAGPPPPPSNINCPRPAWWWEAECAPSSGELTPGQLASICALAGSQSLLFDWPAGSEVDSFCTVITPAEPADLRAQAKSEFAALLANWSAGQLGVIAPDAQPIRLSNTMPVLCDGVLAQNVAGLVETARVGSYPYAYYLDDNPAHPPGLTGVNWGGRSFDGGADTGWYFWGGSLDSDANPDSFPRVELRFSGTATQQAYRYLRLERADGSAPNPGREYRYGGFHEVPFQVWDTDQNVQLDVAFVERTITDASGTIQPPGAQLATFDSTWAPDASGTGGREYIFLLHTPYSPVPKTLYMVDDAMNVVPMSILYALWARLPDPAAVIDDGDRFVFRLAPFSGLGVDADLSSLEGLSLTDPIVQQAYQQITDCLRDINTGVTITNPCDDETAIQLSLVSAEADADRVSLAWYTPEPALAVTIERRENAGDWIALAQVNADGSGMIRYVDTSVAPGARYEYRLTFLDEGVLAHAGEVSIVVPSQLRLSLAGFVPNPARERATVEFVLPVRGRATLEVLDLQGRRIAAREVGHLGPGRATVTLSETGTLRPGIYVIRLRQGGMSVSRKAVVVR